MVLRYIRPFLIIVLILNMFLLSVQLVVSHYDLHPVQKDHNGNKRNHFLFLCYPSYWLASHRTLQFVYFKCIFYVYCDVLFNLLISDNEISQSSNQSNSQCIISNKFENRIKSVL